MAGLTVMGYAPGRSFLHRLDPRFKLLALILISLAGLKAHGLGLLILTGSALPCLFMLRLPMTSLLGETRWFWLLLFTIFLTRSALTPGREVFDAGLLHLKMEGIQDGFLISTRILLVALIGILLICSTRSTAIRAAATWFLSFIPWMPAGRVGVMLGLMVRFIPVVFEKAGEIRAAQRARGVEARRNPVYLIACMALPLMRKIFQAGDDLALAMEARCYTEDRVRPLFESRRLDWLFLCTVLFLCGLALLEFHVFHLLIRSWHFFTPAECSNGGG